MRTVLSAILALAIFTSASSVAQNIEQGQVVGLNESDGSITVKRDDGKTESTFSRTHFFSMLLNKVTRFDTLLNWGMGSWKS
jgi:hypothetical protein